MVTMSVAGAPWQRDYALQDGERLASPASLKESGWNNSSLTVAGG
jgi:hypothetical protein